MPFDVNKAGLFRANPDARVSNSLRIVDHQTPGTPGKDTATANSDAGADNFTRIDGVQYTDKDGATVDVMFFREDTVTAERVPYTLPATASAKELQDAIAKVANAYEVDPIVAVSKASTTFTIEHIGSGTITNLLTDGGTVAFSRGLATSAVGVIEAEAEEAEAE